jgi:lactoylglutathione lyase
MNMPIHVAHIGVWTRDLEKAAEFWKRNFNATVGEVYLSKRRKGFISRFVELPGGGARIELMAGPWVEGFDGRERAGWDHVAISLESKKAVDELAEKCAAEGCLVSGPRVTGDGYYEAVVATADGVRVEVVFG